MFYHPDILEANLHPLTNGFGTDELQRKKKEKKKEKKRTKKKEIKKRIKERNR